MVGGPEIILLYFVVVLMGAKIGGEVATRLKQPAVAGEILVGVILGPSLLGLIPPFEILDHAVDTLTGGFDKDVFLQAQDLHVLAIVAEIGVLILLFEVGLESNLRDFTRVGISAGLVGVYGIVFSFILGAAASYLIAQQISWVLTDTAQSNPNLLHYFIGATLTATSVGITARVLSAMNRIRTKEAQIILGAAVLDDILGLVVLAIVGGLITNPETVTALSAAKIFGLAIGFFIVAIVAGVAIAPRLLDLVHRFFRSPYIHLSFAFVLLMLGSYLATLVGLASIVGAFAAGLALSTSGHRHIIFEHLKPVGNLFISFFFVVLGLRVDLSAVTAETLPLVLIVGGILTVVGVAAKLVAGFGVVRVKASRLIVGVGMVPRGEVGLIFALFGLENGLLNNWQYTTVIIVVLVTTLITPSWLARLKDRFVEEPVAYAPESGRLKESMD